MYHTEPPTDKKIREWYMNSSRVAACVLRNEQAVRAYGPSVSCTVISCATLTQDTPITLTSDNRTVGHVYYSKLCHMDPRHRLR